MGNKKRVLKKSNTCNSRLSRSTSKAKAPTANSAKLANTSKAASSIDDGAHAGGSESESEDITFTDIDESHETLQTNHESSSSHSHSITTSPIGPMPRTESEVNVNLHGNPSKSNEAVPPENCLEYPESFFKFCSVGSTIGSLLYYCQVENCAGSKNTYSATRNSRGNLKKHIKTIHPKQLDTFNKLCKEIDAKKRSGSSANGSVTHSAATMEEKGKADRQYKFSFSGYPRLISQDEFDGYIVEFLCGAVLPVYLTENKAFRNLMKRILPRLRVKSRKTYKNKISLAFAKQKSILIATLASVSWVCTTADAWSCMRKSYIGITVHWIAQDLTRKSACLAVRRVKGTCNYEVIAKLLESVHSEFGIINKITSTITDNGSNFIKAFRMFGEPDEDDCIPIVRDRGGTSKDDFQKSSASLPISTPRSCRPSVGNISQRVIPDSSITTALDDAQSDSNDSESDSSESELSEHEAEPDVEHGSLQKTTVPSIEKQQENEEISDLDAFNVEYFSITEMLDDRESTRLLYSLPTHRRCACHTLNLIAKYDVVKHLKDPLKNLMKDTEKKLSTLWSKQNRSPKAADAIKARLNGLFVIHNQTRWNSYYYALNRVKMFLVKKKEDLVAVFKYFGVEQLRPAEENFIFEYCKLMKPLAEALDVLQAEKNVSVGFLLPTLFVLMKKMKNLLHNPQIILCKELVSSIIEGLNDRFSNCFADDNLIIAAMLHPSFKLSWVEDDSRHFKMEIFMNAYDRFQDITSIMSTRNVGDGASTDSDLDTCGPTPPKKDFFKLLRKQNPEPSGNNEIELYFNDASTDVESLNKYPTLKRMFTKYNAALPSSAAVERLFSSAGRIFQPSRNQLSDSNFEKLLFLKVNQFEN